MASILLFSSIQDPKMRHQSKTLFTPKSIILNNCQNHSGHTQLSRYSQGPDSFFWLTSSNRPITVSRDIWKKKEAAQDDWDGGHRLKKTEPSISLINDRKLVLSTVYKYSMSMAVSLQDRWQYLFYCLCACVLHDVAWLKRGHCKYQAVNSIIISS